MRITYIGHSGFAVEFDALVLIFDYYEGVIPEFDPHKKIYFFVSHKHQDHFNREIFQYALKYPKVSYILSNDVKMSRGYMERIGIPQEAIARICYVRKNDALQVEQGLFIETLRSTDEGVAYLVRYEEDGKMTNLYHAGDLNWWSWSGETPEDNDQMAKAFLQEMDRIKGREFDVAFVPLDPRQEERFWWGFDAFMKTTHTKKAIPMHCWEDYSIITTFLAMEESAQYRESIVVVEKRGQVFEY